MHDLLASVIMKDETIQDAIQTVKTGGPFPIKSTPSDWKIEDGLLFFKEKCYVPPKNDLSAEISQWDRGRTPWAIQDH